MDCNVRLSLEELRYTLIVLDGRLSSLRDDEQSLLDYIDLIQSNGDNATDEILNLLSVQKDITFLENLINYLKTFDKFSYLRGIL